MPIRLRLPKDWKRRATRAIRNLNKPGVGAVWPSQTDCKAATAETAALMSCIEGLFPAVYRLPLE